MSVRVAPPVSSTSMARNSAFSFSAPMKNTCFENAIKFEMSTEVEDQQARDACAPKHLSNSGAKLLSLPTAINSCLRTTQEALGRIKPSELASRLVLDARALDSRLLLVDCRSFLQYNEDHIRGALNISCSDKFKQKRLRSGRLQISDLVSPVEARDDWRERARRDIVLYDEHTRDEASASAALRIILQSLEKEGTTAKILEGGLSEFRSQHGHLCRTVEPLNNDCIPEPQTPRIEEQPISKVLPYLFLGNECDSRSAERLREHGITAVINVTQTSPMPPAEASVRALRLPAADNCVQNLRQYFEEAFDFIESVREEKGVVLVHCYAGISRSATLTIGYLMRYHFMSMSKAYDFVKDCRPVISPNLNFMGQLLQLEEELAAKRGVSPSAPGCNLKASAQHPPTPIVAPTTLSLMPHYLRLPSAKRNSPRALSIDPSETSLSSDLPSQQSTRCTAAKAQKSSDSISSQSATFDVQSTPIQGPASPLFPTALKTLSINPNSCRESVDVGCSSEHQLRDPRSLSSSEQCPFFFGLATRSADTSSSGKACQVSGAAAVSHCPEPRSSLLATNTQNSTVVYCPEQDDDLSPDAEQQKMSFSRILPSPASLTSQGVDAAKAKQSGCQLETGGDLLEHCL